MTACEELRIQGQYGVDGLAIDDMIRSFPNDLLSMFNFLLERLEKDMHQFCVEIGHETPGRYVVQVRVIVVVVVVVVVVFAVVLDLSSSPTTMCQRSNHDLPAPRVTC